jgi:hypothetical protein
LYPQLSAQALSTRPLVQACGLGTGAVSTGFGALGLGIGAVGIGFGALGLRTGYVGTALGALGLGTGAVGTGLVCRFIVTPVLQ